MIEGIFSFCKEEEGSLEDVQLYYFLINSSILLYPERIQSLARLVVGPNIPLNGKAA